MRQFVCFSVVGGLAFFVDTAVFYLCVSGFAMELNRARCLAFSVAAIATWLGNRHLTFGNACRQHWWRQLIKHFGVASLGFILNLVIFNVALSLAWPLPLAFVLGVGAGLVTNFVLSRTLVFVGKAPAGANDDSKGVTGC